MIEFEQKVSAAVHAEVRAALETRSPSRLAGVITMLAHDLGTSIALAAAGDPKGIDELVAGTDQFVLETAIAKAEMARQVARGEAVLGPDQENGS